ncbi:MAG: hypothetical protein ACI8W8_000511 [Rhodothermales bacterium]|jgi:hypothetical protein
MTVLSKEEIAETVASLKAMGERMARDPQYAREVLKCIDDRPLTEQPALTPKQRADRLMGYE